jgi:hypothetical protein
VDAGPASASSVDSQGSARWYGLIHENGLHVVEKSLEDINRALDDYKLRPDYRPGQFLDIVTFGNYKSAQLMWELSKSTELTIRTLRACLPPPPTAASAATGTSSSGPEGGPTASLPSVDSAAQAKGGDESSDASRQNRKGRSKKQKKEE